MHIQIWANKIQAFQHVTINFFMLHFTIRQKTCKHQHLKLICVKCCSSKLMFKMPAKIDYLK